MIIPAKRKQVFLSLLSIVFVLGLFCLNPLFAKEKAIAVICSRKIEPYNDALFGFKEELNRAGYTPSVHRYDLEDAAGKEMQLIQAVKNLKPALVLAIGTEATLLAKNNFREFPVVFSMVLNPVRRGVVKSLTSPGNNLTGVSLDIPAEAQFRTLKKILPKIQRIGIIYNIREKEWLEKIEQAARNVNLSIVPKVVNAGWNVSLRVDEIVTEADCLWVQVDPLVYNNDSMGYVLSTLLANKVPLMTYSPQFVKAGALLALECDYKDTGRQSAKIALNILNGKNPGSIDIASPEKVQLVINRETAEVLGIKIPEEVLAEAKEIYR